jgi:hypothetical protein
VGYHRNQEVSQTFRYHALFDANFFRWITNGTFADYFTTGCKTEVRPFDQSLFLCNSSMNRLASPSFWFQEDRVCPQSQSRRRTRPRQELPTLYTTRSASRSHTHWGKSATACPLSSPISITSDGWSHAPVWLRKE